MTLQRLHLDMARPPRLANAAGLALLLAGVLALASALAWADAGSRRLLQAQADLDAQLERVGARQARKDKPPPPDPQQARARRTLMAMQQELATPWAQLLGAVEAGQNDDVALLLIEPVAAERLVRLQLEARDTGAMLRYLQSLQADPRLGGVTLQMHQPSPDGQPRAVRFQVQGRWGGRP